MSARLYAIRYDADGNIERFTDNIADVGIRWALPGGIQRFEVKIRARSVSAAFWHFRLSIGDEMVIYDNACDRPIAQGPIYEIIPDGRFVTFVCAGYYQQLFSTLYTLPDFGTITATANTDTVIEDILSAAASGIISSDQSNIAATGLDVGGWIPEATVGTPAGDAIEQLVAMGTTSDETLWFWLDMAPFSGTASNLPVPYMVASSEAADVRWRVRAADVAAGGLTVSRHIYELKNSVNIGYHRLTGTHTGINNASTLTDAAAGFLAAGVALGDTIINVTDRSQGEISSVTATQITPTVLTGGTDNDFDTNDRYVVIMKNTAWTSTGTGTGFSKLTAEYREIRPEMDATQAAQYRDTLLELYRRPIKQQAFILGGRAIYDRSGGRHPLWRVIAEGGGYMLFRDFYPEEAVLSTSFNIDQAFRITALDYTYANNRLRIVPDSGDARLDVLLGQALNNERRHSQIISTAAGATTTGGDNGRSGIGGQFQIPPGFINSGINVREYLLWLNNMTAGGPGGNWG